MKSEDTIQSSLFDQHMDAVMSDYVHGGEALLSASIAAALGRPAELNAFKRGRQHGKQRMVMNKFTTHRGAA